MKLLRRIFLTLLLIGTLVILFRGWIYRHVVTYRSCGQRISYVITDGSLISYIDSCGAQKIDTSIGSITKLALHITSQRLDFTVAKNEIDPNLLFHSQHAHCVGYAAYYTSTCNYLLRKYGLSNTWIARPQVAHLYLFGVNIHSYLKNPFWADHDFVTIENSTTLQALAVDPTLNDYLFIDFVNLAK